MLRLIHNQTVQGGILVDDIDDGLPNKEVHRLGSTADPKAYVRDGYANKAKQPCYIPRAHAAVPTLAGFIDLDQTTRVLASAGKGKIQKLKTAGLITVVSMTASQLATPVVTASTTVVANYVITGTTLTSVQPDTTTVTFAKGTAATTPNPAVWTQAAIVAAGGSVSATQISIPVASFVQAPVANNTVTVTANEKNSNTFTTT